MNYCGLIILHTQSCEEILILCVSALLVGADAGGGGLMASVCY